MAPFRDRVHAGRELAPHLDRMRLPQPIVVGIAPGGVPVAYEVAHALSAPLEAWAAWQLHAGGEPTDHVGAMAENGSHGYALERSGETELSAEELAEIARSEHAAFAERAAHVRHRPRTSMRNQTVVLVDDGVATGATLRAAIRSIRQEKPHRIVVGVPVVVKRALARVDRYADAFVWLHECEELPGIAGAYDDFGAVEDGAVATLLDRRRHELATRPSSPPKRS